MGAAYSCCWSVTTNCRPPSTAAATLSGCPSIVAAISNSSLGVNMREHIALAAANPPAMAAALLPKPRAKGISLRQTSRTGGISLSASWKRNVIERYTRLVASSGASSTPSPMT